MNTTYIKSEIETNKKNYRKFAKSLRRLSTLEDLKSNKIKVTIISENEIIEEKKNFFTEPSAFKNYSEDSTEQSMNESESVNSFENPNLEIILSPFIEQADYPDSSDLSGEE